MKYQNKLVIILLTLFALRLAYAAWTPFDLSPDEAHYWEWSRRLDFSYYSKGPLVAWVIAFFTSVFGVSATAVRFGAALFSALASYAVYLFARDAFNSEKTGFYSAVVINAVPVFSIGSILMTTDMPFVFFWTAALWSTQKALDTGRPAWWIASGALAGFGFLSKYTMALIAPCVLLHILFSGADRRWIKSPWPYIAAVVAVIISTPVIYWNISHGEVTIKHTLGQVHADAPEYSVKPALEFLASQLLLVTPLIFAAAVFGAFAAGRAGLGEKNRGASLAFFASAPVFLFFFFKAFHGKVQANWGVAAYMSSAGAAVWAFERLLKRSGRGGVKTLKFAAGAAIAVSATASLFAYFPWAAEGFGAKKVLYGAPFNRVTAWRELGAKISEARRSMPPGSFVMSDTYQIASEIAFYTEGNPVAYNVDTGGRRMNQYDLWPGPESAQKGLGAIYVKGGDASAEEAVTSAFESCSKEVFTIYRKGAPLKDFSIWRCYNFKGMAKKTGHTKF